MRLFEAVEALSPAPASCSLCRVSRKSARCIYRRRAKRIRFLLELVCKVRLLSSCPSFRVLLSGTVARTKAFWVEERTVQMRCRVGSGKAPADTECIASSSPIPLHHFLRTSTPPPMVHLQGAACRFPSPRARRQSLVQDLRALVASHPWHRYSSQTAPACVSGSLAFGSFVYAQDRLAAWLCANTMTIPLSASGFLFADLLVKHLVERGAPGRPLFRKACF